jgi:hypothetical protein
VDTMSKPGGTKSGYCGSNFDELVYRSGGRELLCRIWGAPGRPRFGAA